MITPQDCCRNIIIIDNRQKTKHIQRNRYQTLYYVSWLRIHANNVHTLLFTNWLQYRHTHSKNNTYVYVSFTFFVISIEHKKRIEANNPTQPISSRKFKTKHYYEDGTAESIAVSDPISRVLGGGHCLVQSRARQAKYAQHKQSSRY